MAVASIAGIKRVSIEALVNGNMTKADASAIVRRIAGERGLDGYCYDATGARPPEPRRTGRMDLRLPYGGGAGSTGRTLALGGCIGKCTTRIR